MKKLFSIVISISAPTLFSQETASAPKKWTHESEASVVIVGGNSDTETYNAKQKTSYEFGAHKLTLSGHYLLGKSDDQTSAENWSAGLRYDLAFNPSLGIYLGESISGDRFRRISQQYDSDAGLKYTFWKATDKDFAAAEIGYRYTVIEYAYASSDDTHYARAYLEASKSISDAVLAKAWAEYLPNLEETDKYLINFEPSLLFSLNTYFSVKTGLLGRYDSIPSGTEKFDYTYTLALIAKY